MIAGKEGWKRKEELKQAYVERYCKLKGISVDGVDYDSLPKDYDILASLYIGAVQEEKSFTPKWDLATERAKVKYIKRTKNKGPIFDDLDEAKRKELIEIELAEINSGKVPYNESITVAIENATKIAKASVKRIEELEPTGKIRKDIVPLQTPFDILFNITEEKPSQEEYLIPELVNEWYKSYIGEDRFPKDGVIDKNGKLKLEYEEMEINVYCFQNGDIGANNFMKFNGDLGKKGEEYFAISATTYKELQQKDSSGNNKYFGENGACKNIDGLSRALGNVPLGSNPICISRKMKLKDLQTSCGALNTAYFGEFSPPLSTQGLDADGNSIGFPEAVVPSTTIWSKDITIISHSQNITSKDLNILLKTLFEKITEFLSKQNNDKTQKTINHWTFMNSLDKDTELLKKFKETLTKTEQEYLSKLMVHLQTAMQREEVATVGKGMM